MKGKRTPYVQVLKTFNSQWKTTENHQKTIWYFFLQFRTSRYVGYFFRYNLLAVQLNILPFATTQICCTLQTLDKLSSLCSMLPIACGKNKWSQNPENLSFLENSEPNFSWPKTIKKCTVNDKSMPVLTDQFKQPIHPSHLKIVWNEL